MSALPDYDAEGLLGELHLRRLLVAIDGSENADLALSAAIRAARDDNAALTVLTVEPDLQAEAMRWSGAGAPIDAAPQMAAREEAERTLREALAKIPDDIPIRTVHRFGRAGPEIVAEADTGDYDAVLLGARGVGRVGALLGSVSQHVLHHAKVSVIVTRA
jgi:nucleotide-binding universal stress UspA family protein